MTEQQFATSMYNFAALLGKSVAGKLGQFNQEFVVAPRDPEKAIELGRAITRLIKANGATQSEAQDALKFADYFLACAFDGTRVPESQPTAEELRVAKRFLQGAVRLSPDPSAQPQAVQAANRPDLQRSRASRSPSGRGRK